MKRRALAAAVAVQAIIALAPTGAAAAFLEVHAESTYDAFPAVLSLPSNELLVTFRIGSAHASPDGRIVLARSRNRGATWSTRTIYDERGVDDRSHLGLTRLRDGTLVLPFYKYDGAVPRGSFLLRSTDGGRRWSARRVTSPASLPYFAVYGKVVELPSGTLLLAGYAPDRTVILRSTDKGKTWAPHSAIEGVAETSIVALDSRRLLSLSRAAALSSAHAIYVAHSDDRGRTWSGPRYVFDGVSPDAIRLRRGRLLGCAADRVKLGIKCRTSRDGKRWSAPTTLYSSPTVDFGYPASVVLPGGRVFTAFYGDGGDVLGLRWSSSHSSASSPSAAQ